VIVNGLPGSGKTTRAGRLGEAAGTAVVSKDTVDRRSGRGERDAV
jgi:predicted kinase